MFFTWLVFQISTIFHDFSIEISQKPRIFHVRYKNWQKLGKIGKNWKIHVFSLTPISNFHGFSIEITEIHVFSTLVKKILVFPRFVEISTLVATLLVYLVTALVPSERSCLYIWQPAREGSRFLVAFTPSNSNILVAHAYTILDIFRIIRDITLKNSA